MSIIVFTNMITTPIMAAELNNKNNLPDNSITYVACPEGGKHNMHSIGYAFIYSGPSSANPGELLLHGGNTNQCSKCGLYVGAQFCPQTWGFLGSYTMGYNVPYDGSSYYFYGGIMGEYWSLTEDSFIQGFEWLF